jgi:hydrogenase maturation factor HypF (carbamoyltransferase family)
VPFTLIIEQVLETQTSDNMQKARCYAKGTVIIDGRIQNVGYRAFVKRTASMLGLKGLVRNLHKRFAKMCVTVWVLAVLSLWSVLQQRRVFDPLCRVSR